MSDARPEPIDAGPFTAWVRMTQAAVRGERDAVVPCGTCTACCTSAQFVHIAPDEADTLAHIPAELLFPAPRAPRGHVLMGYDDQGQCPMLVDGACSIYAHRPRTCRTYDCRVFPAAGLDAADDGKPAIAERARRWHFSHLAAEDEVRHAAVRAAVRFVREHAPSLPAGSVPPTATHLAVAAVMVHDLFVGEEAGAPALTEPSAGAVGDALARR